jgi:deoxyribonuclease (pyrimidine dimer)
MFICDTWTNDVTRINLVPPVELTDQHLFAEFREMKMIAPSLARSLKNHSSSEVLDRIPSNFTLGKGHVMFFYNKGTYLNRRYAEILRELDRRGVNYSKDSQLDPTQVYQILSSEFWHDYEPTPDALGIIRDRIAERIAKQPKWYKYYGDSISLMNQRLTKM